MKQDPIARNTILIAVSALSVRLINFLLVQGQPLTSWPVVDAKWHHLWADMVSTGNVSAYAPFFRAPLYPWCLGLWYRIFGATAQAGEIMSVMWSVIAAVVFYRIASRKLPGRWALVAGIVWVLWGTDVFYSSTLLITPMYTALLLLTFDCLDTGRGRWGWLLLGLACIARPSAIILVPLAVFIFRPRFIQASLFLAPVLLVWIFNISSGDPGTVISSQGGINLYLGNGPEADGYTAFAPSSGDQGDGDPDLPYQDNVQSASGAGLPSGWSGSRISALWVRRTVDHALSKPLDVLVLAGRKFLYAVSPVEIPSNYDPYYFRPFSPVLAVLLLPGPFALPFLLLWILLPGAILAGKLTREELILLIWSALLFLGMLTFFVTARFRLPAVPFLLLFLFLRISRKPRKALLSAPVGLITGMALALFTGHTVRSGGVNMPFFDGLAHVEEGDLDGAEILFMESLSRASLRLDGMDMNRSDAMYNLGVIAIRQGRLSEAESWFRATLEYNPLFEPAREALHSVEGLD